MVPSRASLAYEDRKRSHLHTAQLFSDQSLQFLPLVAEACGCGWGPVAVRTWRSLGALIAGRTGESPSAVVEQLYQAFSVALQRENARAILRHKNTYQVQRGASVCALTEWPLAELSFLAASRAAFIAPAPASHHRLPAPPSLGF